MTQVVRKGYVFFRGHQAFMAGEQVPDVTEKELIEQGWKLEPILAKKSLDEKTVLNRSMRGANTR